MSNKTLLCVISLIVFLAGCSSAPKKVGVTPPDHAVISVPPGTANIASEKRFEILKQISERNRNIENNEKWIEHSYSGLMIRRMINVTEAEYGDYKKYLDNDSVYIVVHPAFFPFFHDFRKLSKTDEDGPYPEDNVVDKFLALKPKSEVFQVLQAQERRMRDFIEFKSTEEKLVIIVVPKNYYKYKGYTYRKTADEYMRYLNEITNFSKSVLFVESRSPNRGYITEENSVKLMEFLLSINAKNIYIVGGYIGRCLEDFYKLLIEDYGSDGIYIIPELSDISPRELSPALARDILMPDGTLDRDLLTEFIKKNVYKSQEVVPPVKNLP